MKTKKLLLAAALCALVGSVQDVGATTAPGSFTVQITVTSFCNVTTNNLNFGSVAANAVLTTTGSTTLGVQCSDTTPYVVNLTPSNASTTGAGKMAGTGGNTDTVGYQLNQAAGSTPWGNQAGNHVSGTGNGSSQSITVFSSITVANTSPASGFVKPDTYSDTVNVAVVY